MDSEENLISTGCNDVPKFGGGQYPMLNGVEDHRCGHEHGEVKCYNETKRHQITKEILDIIKHEIKNDSSLAPIKNIHIEKFSEALELKIKKQLQNITEYSRAVHAEMACIINAMLINRSVKGGSVYCTTYPCHDCTKHMVMAGIKKLFYIEPYEKSIASEMLFDSVSTEDKDDRMSILPYEGIGPRMFTILFDAGKRKRNKHTSKSERKPRLTQQLDPFSVYEAKITQNLEKIQLFKRSLG